MRNGFKRFALFTELLILENMSLRRSQRNKSNHIKLNLKERIKTILDGNEKGIIIECYGDKG